MFLRVLVLTALLATPALSTFALAIGGAAVVAVSWGIVLARRADGLAGKALPVRNPFCGDRRIDGARLALARIHSPVRRRRGVSRRHGCGMDDGQLISRMQSVLHAI